MKHAIAGIAMLAALFMHAADAATCTWIGAGAANLWSTAENWNCGDIAHPTPVSGDTVAIGDVVAGRFEDSVNDISALELAELVFSGSEQSDVSHCFIPLLSCPDDSNLITLTTGLSVTGPGSITAVGSLALDVKLVSNAQTLQCGGSAIFDFAGSLDLNGLGLTVAGDGFPIIAGKVTGSGGITKNDTGILTVNGLDNDYTGTTTINGGTVVAASATSLGAAGVGNETIVKDGATLALDGYPIAESLMLSGTGSGGEGALAAADFGDNAVTGDITLTGDTTINPGAGTLTLSGVIDGDFAVTKTGSGTLILTNVNSYSGGTTVTAGTLRIEGEVGAVTVNDAATLAGSGAVGAITLNSGGTIAPGGRPGTLSAASFAWNGGAKLVEQLGANDAVSDHLVIAGALSKESGNGFAIELQDAATPPTAGTTYTLAGFASNNFALGDFSVTYAGTGPGSSLTGTLALTSVTLQYTVESVVSDLVFRDGMD